MNTRRTTYSMSPSCLILALALLLAVGFVIGVGVEIAKELT